VDTVKNDKTGKLVSFALLGLGLSQDADHEQAGTVVLDYFNTRVKKSEKGASEDALCTAAVALGALKYGEAAKPLALALGNKDVSDVVRCYCAQALGRIRGEAAQKALEGALSKSSQEVTRAAAIALGNFDDVKVASTLFGKEGLKNSDPLSAGLSAVSLGRVLSATDADTWKGAPEELRKLAMEPAKGAVRAQYASLALSLFGGVDTNMQKFLRASILESKFDKDVLAAMAMTCGMAGLSDMQSVLLGMAKDAGGNVRTRAYAATALGMVGQSQARETVKSLRELYQASEDPNVRRGAVFGMGFVGDRADVPFLLSVIEAAKEDTAIARYTRGAAVVAVGMIRDGESIGRIQDLTGRADARTRAYAIAALGYLADKDEVPAMSQLFASTNFRQRCASVDALMYQL
jgi:HEAT repeat protein